MAKLVSTFPCYLLCKTSYVSPYKLAEGIYLEVFGVVVFLKF